nr:DUF6705 family protein [uncultured Chryseobacterium sp.]
MKITAHNKMKNIILILSFLVFTINTSCKAQTVSLETMSQCSQHPETCPNATYLKDINNSLNKFVGTWSGSYNGKSYEFKFIKQLNFGMENNFKWDRLVGRLRVKDTHGSIIYDTFNETDDSKTNLEGDNFQSNLKAYIMNFSGNNTDCNEFGNVYLFIKPDIPNIMTVSLLPGNDIGIEGKCPSNFQPTIPYRKTITLIKQ